MSGDTAGEDRPYLDGMLTAATVVRVVGDVGVRELSFAVHDDQGKPEEAARLLGEILEDDPTAILYVGPGDVLSSLRPRLVDAGGPVVLLGGDLYTSRGLFRQVFQTSIPWAWQAHVIARYLVRDREANRIVFAAAGPEAEEATTALRASLGYWGGSLADAVTLPAGGALAGALAAVREADAVVVLGSPFDVGRLAAGVEETPESPQVAGSSHLLGATSDPAPGTVACYMYTWAGWAEPIPRVGSFGSGFEALTEHPVVGLEQEGFDAVRILGATLARTSGRGGAELVGALEQTRNLTFSGFPVTLGPGDHLFPSRDELGLFAVAGPNEEMDPWQESGEGWRALMRTFTYDGRRTNILPRDRRIFFPFWNQMLPAPNYWRSRYGIVTRTNDQLH